MGFWYGLDALKSLNMGMGKNEIYGYKHMGLNPYTHTHIEIRIDYFECDALKNKIETLFIIKLRITHVNMNSLKLRCMF